MDRTGILVLQMTAPSLAGIAPSMLFRIDG